MAAMSQDHDTVIVFAIDFSEMTDYVIQSALTMASTHQRPALHAVCVIEPSKHVLRPEQAQEMPDELEELKKAVRARIARALDDAGHGLDDPGDWTVVTHAVRGAPAVEIDEIAGQNKADTIIVGRHGAAGFRPYLLGSVPSRLLAIARCTVMVVQPPSYH